MQLQYAWRVGMERGEAERLAAEAEEIATRRGDLHSLAMLKMLTSARPGRRTPGPRLAAAVGGDRSGSPTSRATPICGWRSGPRAAYA